METTFQNLYWHTDEHVALYHEWTRGLPGYPPNWPCGLGPHAVPWIQGIVKAIQPLRMLEIGFNLGSSAACWLANGIALTSVDINRAKIVADAGKVLKDRWGYLFDLIICDSDMRLCILREERLDFDTIFIDGAHDAQSVYEDIQLARALGISRMLFDDWYPETGPGVQEAILRDGALKIQAVFGGIGYCTTMDQSWHKYKVDGACDHPPLRELDH